MKRRRGALVREAARVVVFVRRPDADLAGDFEKLLWRGLGGGGAGIDSPQVSIMPHNRRLGVSL